MQNSHPIVFSCALYKYISTVAAAVVSVVVGNRRTNMPRTMFVRSSGMTWKMVKRRKNGLAKLVTHKDLMYFRNGFISSSLLKMKIEEFALKWSTTMLYGRLNSQQKSVRWKRNGFLFHSVFVASLLSFANTGNNMSNETTKNGNEDVKSNCKKTCKKMDE